MIISVSRRTDIPAFFSEWFMNRIREQYCLAVNPFNRKQISRISLKPEEVDALVFWTRNPRPLLPHLTLLSELGYRYYFQFTVNGYGAELEPGLPELGNCLDIFGELSERLGPERVIWRYDPILISNRTGISYHQERFSFLLEQLQGLTKRVVVSIADDYRKTSIQYRRLRQAGIEVKKNERPDEVAGLIADMADRATGKGLEIFSCAEKMDLTPYGVKPGKCIDADLLNRLFALRLKPVKDRSQRQECGCVISKDVGYYDTCRHGCCYCYAGTKDAGEANRSKHDPFSPTLLG